MATRGCIKESEIEWITTTQILEKLKEADSDNTEFFYLLFSTGDVEDDYDDDDDDDDLKSDKPMETNPLSNPSSVLPPPPPPAVNKNTRKTIMRKVLRKVHKDILPQILCPDGWKKVCDKDRKSTYRALYFNIIPKDKDEDDSWYIQRVSKIRNTLSKEIDKLRVQYDVNFKIHSLLSKPFLYDEDYLTEQSMREGYPQMRNK